MQEALALLVDLDSKDTERRVAIGTEREVHRGVGGLSEGLRPDEFFIVLEGLVENALNSFSEMSLAISDRHQHAHSRRFIVQCSGSTGVGSRPALVRAASPSRASITTIGRFSSGAEPR